MTTNDSLPPPCTVCGSVARKSDATCASCGAEAPSDAAAADRAAAHWAAEPNEIPDPLLGAVVAGKFEVQRLLGEGGAGRVYLAEQLGLNRPVALKLMHRHLASEQDQKARFHREARAASRLRHRGAVTVYDFGVWEGQLFIALEFLPGRTLAEVLDSEYPLGDHRVVHLLSQVADVLEHAHDSGVLHRDLKPENVMVSLAPDGKEGIKVVDFGLAILYGPQTEAKLTQEGVITGTPAYMSPEQIRGEELDPQSDLYSLGIMLYEMLCGEVPFGGQNVTDILIGHMFHAPPAPSTVETELPIHPHLETLALRTLSKSRFERPKTVAEFHRDLLAGLQLPASEPPSIGQSPDTAQDRDGRADAAGLRRPPSATRLERLTRPSYRPLVVVEPDGRARDSLSTLLQANGHVVETAAGLEDALQKLSSQIPAATVVDLRADPSAHLSALAGQLTEGLLAGRPVIIVGPEDDMELMTWALNLGLSNYVPQSTVGEKLPKIVARVLRRLRRKSPNSPDS